MYLSNTTYLEWGQTVPLTRKILEFSTEEGVKNQSSSWAENASKLEGIAQTEMLRDDPAIINLLFEGKLPPFKKILSKRNGIFFLIIFFHHRKICYDFPVSILHGFK